MYVWICSGWWVVALAILAEWQSVWAHPWYTKCVWHNLWKSLLCICCMYMPGVLMKAYVWLAAAAAAKRLEQKLGNKKVSIYHNIQLFTEQGFVYTSLKNLSLLALRVVCVCLYVDVCMRACMCVCMWPMTTRIFGVLHYSGVVPRCFHHNFASEAACH